MSTSELARQRVLAWIIDSLVVIGAALLVGGLGWLVFVVYWLLRDGLFDGQSIGKRVLGLRVVAGAAARDRCTFKASAIRNVLWVIPIVNVVMALTGLHYMMHDQRGRHWGDRLAETQVVAAA